MSAINSHLFLFPRCLCGIYEKGERAVVSCHTDIVPTDSLFVSVSYNNKVKEADGKAVAEVVSMGRVPCPRIIPLSVNVQYKDDPVKFESLWKSQSGNYMNLHLQLKTGQTEDSTAVQKLEFFSDQVIVYPDGRRTLPVLLHHDQGGVPEYYSTQAYISIPTANLDVDSVRFRINTYSGLVIKTLPLQ